MSNNGESRSSGSRKGGSMAAGILIGMVLGLSIAGGVAWYLQKSPSPFVSNVPHETLKPVPEADSKPVAAASSVPSDGKPRFEFYKVLTDKPDTTAPAPKGGAKPSVTESKPKKPGEAANPADKQVVRESYLLQAGAFSHAEEADKQKAKLAMLGMEANIQTVTIPDKGVWYRVRLGPYKGADAMNKAMATLKQNGVEATSIRVQ